MKMSDEALTFVIARLLENAKDAKEESMKDRADMFAAGRKVAYYEMLDTLKSELDVHDADLKAFGLDVDVDRLV